MRGLYCVCESVIFATIAQFVEHSPCKRDVVGSIPTCSSILHQMGIETHAEDAIRVAVSAILTPLVQFNLRNKYNG